MVLLIWLPGNNNDAVCAEIDAASVRLARSSDSPLPLSLWFARPPRSVLTNQSRVQDGLFYGCGDGLMDFEVPDAISAQAGGLKVKQHRRETFKGRDSQAKGK